MDYSFANINNWNRLGMRKSFGKMIIEMMELHDDIVVLCADVASSAGLSDFDEKYRHRIINVGIAEQNMVGIAAGLAKEGKNVFVLSFAPFVSLRVYEAVRTLVGYMHLNVKIVALASGFSLGIQGNTHYCLEDIGLMRMIPGMLVLSPADCMEEAADIEHLSEYNGPAYLRLTGIDGMPSVYREKPIIDYSKPQLIREGDDVGIIATGSVVNECVRAARLLKKDDISCAVLNLNVIEPLCDDYIKEYGSKYKLIVTVEEHFVNAGLGGTVAECLSEVKVKAPLYRIGISNEFPEAGDYIYLLNSNNLNAAGIREQIYNIYNKIGG